MIIFSPVNKLPAIARKAISFRRVAAAERRSDHRSNLPEQTLDNGNKAALDGH
jgi:hypothetical protein